MRGLCLNIKDPFSPVSLLRTTTRGAAKPITSNSFNSASASQCGNGNSSTGVEFMIGSSSRRTSSAFSFSVWTIVFFLSVLTINAEANPSRQEPVILEGSSKQRIRQPTWIVLGLTVSPCYPPSGIILEKYQHRIMVTGGIYAGSLQESGRGYRHRQYPRQSYRDRRRQGATRH